MLKHDFVVGADHLHNNHYKNTTQKKKKEQIGYFCSLIHNSIPCKIHPLFWSFFLLCWHWLAFYVVSNYIILKACHGLTAQNSELQFLQQIKCYLELTIHCQLPCRQRRLLRKKSSSATYRKWRLGLFITYRKKLLKLYFLSALLSCGGYNKFQLFILENRLKIVAHNGKSHHSKERIWDVGIDL